MPKKITWKKGMRLGKEVFDSSDQMKYDALFQIATMATNGRFGLYKSTKPFQLEVNITNNIIEVTSLCCHGITKSGNLVDIEFDSSYTNTFDTRVIIPSDKEEEVFFLVIRMFDGEWRELSDNLSESKYTFELIGENSPIDENMLPIGCIVNQYGWRLNDVDFVPPCLFINANLKYKEQLMRAKSIMNNVISKCSSSQCIANLCVSSVWNAASSAFFRMDKEEDLLSPNELLSIIQQFVNAFLIGCSVDPHITLSESEKFVQFVNRPLNIKKMYEDIEDGLNLWGEIATKMEVVCEMEAPEPEPVVPPKPVKRERPTPPPTSDDEKRKRRWMGIEV